MHFNSKRLFNKVYFLAYTEFCRNKLKLWKFEFLEKEGRVKVRL